MTRLSHVPMGSQAGADPSENPRWDGVRIRPYGEDRKLSGAEDLMRDQIEGGDREIAHAYADQLLVGVLRRLGYVELCDLYEEVGKWYA